MRLGSAKAVPAPRGKGARIAGTREFDRDPGRFRQRRMEALVAAVRPVCPGPTGIGGSRSGWGRAR